MQTEAIDRGVSLLLGMTFGHYVLKLQRASYVVSCTLRLFRSKLAFVLRNFGASQNGARSVRLFL